MKTMNTLVYILLQHPGEHGMSTVKECAFLSLISSQDDVDVQ